MKKWKEIRLKTNIKDKGHFGTRKKLLIEISSSNLWFIMMALSKDMLVDRLEVQTQALSEELYKIGEEEFEWVKH